MTSDKAKQPNVASKIEQMAEIRKFNERELERRQILHQNVENKTLLKSFRELRTRLQAQSSNGNYVCMVTSVLAEGGASFTAKNLAAAIALDRTKTAMLIDCNLYAPSADQLLAAEANVGMTDYLDHPGMGVEEIVYPSGVPRLRVIPVGHNRDGGTEKITSVRMKQFIQEVKERYSDRYIIIDAPSAGDYDAETRILAELCDHVVLVVPYGGVQESELKSVVDDIGPRLAGMVFNKK